MNEFSTSVVVAVVVNVAVVAVVVNVAVFSQSVSLISLTLSRFNWKMLVGCQNQNLDEKNLNYFPMTNSGS